MAAGRTLRSLVSRRRRASEDGEDEEGPVLVDDSQSEGSILSGPEEEDADGSSLGRISTREQPRPGSAPARSEATASISKQARKSRRTKPSAAPGKKDAAAEQPSSQPDFKAMADTEAMMNGLTVEERSDAQEVVDFESTGQQGALPTASTNGSARKPGERQPRDQDDYRSKREANPAFIPQKGNFFMHDTRGPQNGQGLPVRGAWQMRGRGRGAANAFSSVPARQADPTEEAAEQPWKHDLHETINESRHRGPAGYKSFGAARDQQSSMPGVQKAGAPSEHGSTGPISLSSTTLVGRVQIRISLPGMKAPISFSEVPWKHYIRLPDHRPPLRRDKPVRLALPGHTQRYIFPSTDRSFIFIPRQARSTQHGYNRGAYPRGIGGHGYSSRRTSMYGGSTYSASVAASRRSSMAGMSREHAFSPVGSLVGMPSNRPVVRFPQNGQTFSGPTSGPHTPSAPQMYTYPLPQQPAFQGTPTTMTHHPRPQKAISVTGIESPAVLQNTPSGERQPFQNQLPSHLGEQVSQSQVPPPPYFSPRQQHPYPHQQQPQQGTPLSGIPEQTMSIPSYQPQTYNQMSYYPPYPPHQNFYYSPPGPDGYPPMPLYGAPQAYMMPAPPPLPLHQPYAAPPPAPQPQPTDDYAPRPSDPPPPPPPRQSGMVAHESNGMVFYAPASEAQQQSEHFQPAESFVPSYAMAGLPPPTPAPEQLGFYYPSSQQQGQGQQGQHAGMPEMGAGVFYPGGGQ